MKIKETIKSLETFIKNPSEGLPEEIFLLVSRIVPMVNVDLLIKNKKNQTLLTWRDDGYWKSGWHIPGGIIRYKETFADRLNAVADIELGAKITFKKKPLAINEFIHPSRNNRGHFISLLFECRLISPLDESIKFKKGIPKPGEWAWYSKCPDKIISIHNDLYRKYF